MEDEKGVFKEDDKADMKKPREAKGFLRNDKREFKARARGRGIIRRGGSLQALIEVQLMLILT